MEKVKKKTLTLNIITKIIQWLPICVYGCFNITTSYKTTTSGITFSSIILIGAILCYFKDAFKDWIKQPSVFKYVCIMWVFALIFVLLGDQMFIVCTILLASQLASIPTDVWRHKIGEEAANDKALKDLKKLILG